MILAVYFGLQGGLKFDTSKLFDTLWFWFEWVNSKAPKPQRQNSIKQLCMTRQHDHTALITLQIYFTPNSLELSVTLYY